VWLYGVAAFSKCGELKAVKGLPMILEGVMVCGGGGVHSFESRAGSVFDRSLEDISAMGVCLSEESSVFIRGHEFVHRVILRFSIAQICTMFLWSSEGLCIDVKDDAKGVTLTT